MLPKPSHMKVVFLHLWYTTEPETHHKSMHPVIALMPSKSKAHSLRTECSEAGDESGFRTKDPTLWRQNFHDFLNKSDLLSPLLSDLRGSFLDQAMLLPIHIVLFPSSPVREDILCGLKSRPFQLDIAKLLEKELN